MSVEKYQKTYVDTKFERSDLFKLIREEFGVQKVLYPGCSVHITPAFHFPHLVFVDQDPNAIEFFTKHDTVLEIIKRNRHFKRSPYIQFIAQDFTKPLPIHKNQFDLVLALFTGGVSIACKSYLKLGGFILTNNHHNDALDAACDEELSLIGEVRMIRKKYRFSEQTPESDKILRGRIAASKNNRYLRQTSSGVEYIENEIYYLFKRVRSQKKHQAGKISND